MNRLHYRQRTQRRLVTYARMVAIFAEDAVFLGDQTYSIWAPAKDHEVGRVFSNDTHTLFKKWLARFKVFGEYYDLNTVWE